MSGSLPPPRDGTQRYLEAIHDRLGELLDRLPPPPQPAVDGGQVELREPAAPAPVGGGVSSGPVEDTGGPGVAERPARASTPRKARSPKAPAAGAVKAPKAKPAPRRATSKPTTPKPTPKKGEDT